MKNNHDFIIECGLLEEYAGPGGNVTIPDGVREIKSYTFAGCTALTRVTIPDSLTKIGTGAFQDCTGLISMTIPESVTEIGDEVFQGCENLTIHTPAGSVAEKYAKKNRIKFAVTE